MRMLIYKLTTNLKLAKKSKLLFDFIGIAIGN